MIDAPPTRRFLAALTGLGFAWRVVIDWCTPMPREDGVNYLWMAERFAAGDATAALSEVFSPLLALVIAVPVAFGVEPFVAGQFALAAVGAFVVVPIAMISETLRPGSGRCAAFLTFAASQPVVLGAQIYTEPLFLLVASYAFLFGVRDRFAWCGVLSGVAFWVRPEAAVIPLAFLLGTRRAWVALGPLVAGIVLLAVWRGICGHGFHPVPKLPFIMEHNVAADQGAVERFVQVPRAILEAFWPVAVLAVVGAWRWRPPPIMWVLLFAAVIIWVYVPRRRFFVNWMFAVAPLAAVAVTRLPRRHWWLAAVVVLELVLAIRGGSDANRIVERQVAEHLRDLLGKDDVVAGDMTRVRYFAGFRPLEPRHFSADELVSAGRNARFVVLRGNRAYAEEVQRRLTKHTVWPIPTRFQEHATARGMVVLERTR